MAAQVVGWPARESFRGFAISGSWSPHQRWDDPSRSKGLVTAAGETLSGLDGAGARTARACVHVSKVVMVLLLTL